MSNLPPGRSVVKLPIPLYGQKTSLWCWAAVGQMITTYLGDPETQCAQAQVQSNSTEDCCSVPIPKSCNRGGFPPLNNFHYDLTKSSTPLTWSELKTQLNQNKPVGFNWEWVRSGGESHMLVATGYIKGPSSKYLMINDPLPLNRGDFRIIPYSTYVSGVTHTHGPDIYDITYSSTEPPPLQVSQPMRTTWPPLSTLLGDPQTQGSKEAAEQGLLILESMVQEDTYEQLGFKTRTEILDATLGTPLPSRYLGLADVKSYTENSNSTPFPGDAVEIMYPVIVKKQVRSSIIVEKVNHLWQVESFGSPNEARVSTNARHKCARHLKLDEQAFYTVNIPSMYRFFLAYDKDQKRMLTPLRDDGFFSLKSGSFISDTKMLKRLLPLAKNYKGAVQYPTR